MKTKYKKGFTLAEILVTLTVIGIIAAILFPSILANYNERTLRAKRQAFVARMSQAMGELADQFANFEDVTCTDNSDATTCTDKGSALKFITEGMSKVYKLAATCDADSLDSCDIPKDITRQDGSTFNLHDKKTFHQYNGQIVVGRWIDDDGVPTIYSGLIYDTQSAAFITKNGESVLVYVNPRCDSNNDGSWDYWAETKLCVNMIYDLNGAKKKPNRLGEDIGFLSVFYSNSPFVVSPNVINMSLTPEYQESTESTGTYVSNITTYDNAVKACGHFGEKVVLPTKEEAMSMMANYDLIDVRQDVGIGRSFWTSTMATATKVYLGIACQPDETQRECYGLRLTSASKTEKNLTKCVYEN